jgi:hypothetical protein
MNSLKHPRFLGLFWKVHKFARHQDKPCTQKCIYCDEERHEPRDWETEPLPARPDTKNSWTLKVVEKQFRKCLVCGATEYREYSYGAEIGPNYGPWQKLKNP